MEDLSGALRSPTAEQFLAQGGSMARKVQLREKLHMEKRGAIGEAYRSEKHPANTRCAKCNLVYQDGVWRHATSSDKPPQQWKLCPACTQIRDHLAGGVGQFGGAFVGSHKQELMNRIRNVEKLIREERPLERIIELKEDGEGITVSATSEHLAARMGKSIQRDFGGDLEIRYAPDDKFAYVHWRRD
jgi:hypothetical protein